MMDRGEGRRGKGREEKRRRDPPARLRGLGVHKSEKKEKGLGRWVFLFVSGLARRLCGGERMMRFPYSGEGGAAVCVIMSLGLVFFFWFCD
jgi:hypothetical protein